MQQCVFENIVTGNNVNNSLRKNMNASKPSNQSKGLGRTIDWQLKFLNNVITQRQQ